MNDLLHDLDAKERNGKEEDDGDVQEDDTSGGMAAGVTRSTAAQVKGVLENGFKSAGQPRSRLAAELNPVLKPEIRPELRPEIRPELRPEIRPELRPEIRPELRPEIRPELRPEIRPELRPEIRPELRPEIRPELRPEIGGITTRTVSNSAENLRGAMEMRENIIEVGESHRASQGTSKTVENKTGAPNLCSSSVRSGETTSATDPRSALDSEEWETKRGKVSHSSPAEAPMSTHPSEPPSRWSGWFKTAVHASPGFVRSLVLTSFIFSLYESNVEEVTREAGGGKHVELGDMHVVAAIGAVGGAAHGILHYLSSIALNKVFHRGHASSRLLGSGVAHCLLFSSMFAAYEGTKTLAQRACQGAGLDVGVTKAGGAACIVVSGLVSGYISEGIYHNAIEIESRGVRDGLRYIVKQRALHVPKLRSLAPSMLTAVLGFMAYEYAAASSSLEHRRHTG
jgi:hypothetical protein